MINLCRSEIAWHVGDTLRVQLLCSLLLVEMHEHQQEAGGYISLTLNMEEECGDCELSLVN